MSESNGAWGKLVEHDQAMADTWDQFAELPRPGENAALDQFLASKNLDISALHRIGAKLRNPTCLAYPYDKGLKYRDVVTGQKTGYRGSKFDTLRILKASRECQGVLVVEGETDAMRTSMLYPELDIAMLGAGALGFNGKMALQLAKYPRILVGLDNDEAGEAGWEKIRGALPTAERFAPPAGKADWCEIEDGEDIPDYAAPADNEHVVAGVEFADLSLVNFAELPEPEYAVDDFIYTEGVHWVDGHPGSGKTSITMTMLRAVERHVIWLDWEGGLIPSMRRLMATGWSPPEAVRRFHYAFNPRQPEDVLAELTERWPEAIVVLDSCSKALARRGLSENDNTEVTGWTLHLIEFAKVQRAPVVVIDHIAKTGEGGQYARGAGAKSADTDVHWRVLKHEPFSKEVEGKIHLDLKKDREGDMTFDRWFRIGGDLGLQAVECADPREDPDVPDEAEAKAAGYADI